jgi:hypothetical protein
MLILCQAHGAQSVIQISPDLWDDPNKAAKECGSVGVSYELEGHPVYTFLLSADFARLHDVHESVVPLPGDYPQWVHEMALVCAKCWKEKILTIHRDKAT